LEKKNTNLNLASTKANEDKDEERKKDVEEIKEEVMLEFQ